MKKHIVCLGDSNTHGYCADPADCADGGDRFNEEERWTCLLQKGLGEDYLVLEEGLSGRTTVFPDPCYEGADALTYLYPCLVSHEPVSLLVIMLGTNDSRAIYSANAYNIAAGMRRLVNKAKATDCWAGEPNILVVAPPPVGEGIDHCPYTVEMGPGGVYTSEHLAKYYARIAEETGVHFLDAGKICKFNEVDFMHLTRAEHRKLADHLIRLIPELV